MQPVKGILELNAALFRKALDGVDQAAAERRPNDHTNSLAFIACHALDARFYLLKLAGHERTNPWQSLFDAANDVSTMKEYPPLYEVLAEWDELHEATLGFLAEMSPAELDAESSAQFPTEDRSTLGGIAFLAFHEAYHVGQMGLVRKYLGFDPVVQR
ncbi:MAG: DinB family protein [Gemmatimonadetes bacterium]|nr:DinB family protein [Gemmatimonadota bacterium]NNK47265.1 DinB family protein [Gemmatimonadota bacterium]